MNETQNWKRSFAAGAAVFTLSIGGEALVQKLDAPKLAASRCSRPELAELMAGRIAHAMVALFVTRCS